MQRADYLPGDLVDIRYDPPNKDTPGWRGPAQIASVQADEGNVTVRFQGKTLDRRQQEVRVHVPYLVYLSTVLDHKAHQFGIIKRETENLSSSFVTVGVVHHAGAWSVTPRTRTHDGRRFLDAALAFASQVLHLDRVVTVRACRGVKTMPKLTQYNSAEVIARIRGEGSDSLVSFVPRQQDLNNPFPAQLLAQELEEVDTGKKDWGGSLLHSIFMHQF